MSRGFLNIFHTPRTEQDRPNGGTNTNTHTTPPHATAAFHLMWAKPHGERKKGRVRVKLDACLESVSPRVPVFPLDARRCRSPSVSVRPRRLVCGGLLCRVALRDRLGPPLEKKSVRGSARRGGRGSAGVDGVLALVALGKGAMMVRRGRRGAAARPPRGTGEGDNRVFCVGHRCHANEA
jgi:hypothetical protein